MQKNICTKEALYQISGSFLFDLNPKTLAHLADKKIKFKRGNQNIV